MNLNHVSQWCQLHGYTDPFTVDGRWHAFKGSAVLPVDIDRQARSLWSLPYPHTVNITLDCGQLTYTMLGKKILKADWQWAANADLQPRQVTLTPSCEYLALDGDAVWFQCHPDRLVMLPPSWSAHRIPDAGLMISAAIVSLAYIFDEAEAA